LIGNLLIDSIQSIILAFGCTTGVARYRKQQTKAQFGDVFAKWKQ
jgi:hypothetical protein